MKDLCIIHVGMPKTGSTSIQTALFNNLSENPEANFSSPPLTPQAQVPRIFSLFCSNPEKYHGNAGKSTNEITDLNKKTTEILVKSITDVKQNKYIISSEDIYHMDMEELKRMKSFFSPFFKRIVITGYVRPPRSFLQSAFQQLVKFHEMDTTNSAPPLYHPYLNFKRFDQIFW